MNVTSAVISDTDNVLFEKFIIIQRGILWNETVKWKVLYILHFSLEKLVFLENVS